MIFLPCKLAFCFHYRCLLFAQSGSVNKVHLPWYIFTIAQPWHHFSQAHSQLHCHCLLLQKLGSQPQWEFKSAWYLARCDSTILLQKVPSEGSKSRRRPLLGPSPGWKRLLPLSHLRHYEDTMLNRCFKPREGSRGISPISRLQL